MVEKYCLALKTTFIKLSLNFTNCLFLRRESFFVQQTTAFLLGISLMNLLLLSL